MKAIKIRSFGDKDTLEIHEVPVPVIKENEVLVRVKFSGVNFIDIYQRKGYYPLTLPHTLGLEASGTVAEVGKNVKMYEVGDRVAYAPHPNSYAEMVAVPEEKLVKLPEWISLEDAATLSLQGMTAHYLATDAHTINANDKVLIHAGAGGVGRLLTQILKAKGVTVFSTVSTSEKMQVAKDAGADHIIQYTKEDFEERIMHSTNGAGVQVVYDSVGKTTFQKSLNILGIRGHLISTGQASGRIPPLDLNQLNAKGLKVSRPMLAHYVRTSEERLKRMSDLFEWWKNGIISVRIAGLLPFEEVSQAHQVLESRKAIGKVLLKLNT